MKMKPKLTRAEAKNVLREYPDADLSAFDIEGVLPSEVDALAAEAVSDVLSRIRTMQAAGLCSPVLTRRGDRRLHHRSVQLRGVPDSPAGMGCEMTSNLPVLSDYVPRSQYDAAAADAARWEADSRQAYGEGWNEATGAFEGQLYRVMRMLSNEQRAAFLAEHIGASAYMVVEKLAREDVLRMMVDITVLKAQEDM